MLPLTPQSRIFLATPPVDFRTGMDGLAAVGRQGLGDNPLEGAVDVFRNRMGTALKLWLSDGQGYGRMMQRLSHGPFAWWPQSPDARVPLSARALMLVLWNGHPERAQMAQAGRRVASGEARLWAYAQGSHAAGSAQTSRRCSCNATREATALIPA
jgi:transposase